jgi:predicted GIY-YIG superfamily endonuclease
MDYSKDIQKRLENIIHDGTQGKAEIEGHTAAAAVYREHNMEGAAMNVEMKIKDLQTHQDYLRAEYKRLKKELDELPY